MRGGDLRTEALFSYVSCEARVPCDHPLRPIRAIVNQALENLSPELARLYSRIGRPSIPPEKLLRALLLQAFFSIRSERQLMQQLDYNLLFRWFVGLGIEDPAWDVTVFTKNRDRLLDGDIAAKLFQAVLSQPRIRALLSDDHFTVDGSLIEAWASLKSFKPKGEAGDDGPGDAGNGRNGECNFHGEKRSNATHASTTDPDAKLFRKGRGPPPPTHPGPARARRAGEAGDRGAAASRHHQLLAITTGVALMAGAAEAANETGFQLTISPTRSTTSTTSAGA